MKEKKYSDDFDLSEEYFSKKEFYLFKDEIYEYFPQEDSKPPHY